MDGPVHTTPTHKAGVGSIDNSVGVLLGDVRLYQGKLRLIDGYFHYRLLIYPLREDAFA